MIMTNPARQMSWTVDKLKPLDCEIREDNKIVAGWLLYYQERKKNYFNRRSEIIHSTAPRPQGNVSEACVADKTACQGVKLAQLQETERWLALVEEVEQRLPCKMQILLRLRREYLYNTKKGPGRPSWVPVVQRRYAQELAVQLKKAPEDVWINSPATFHEMWDRIVNYAARIAAKRGLL